MLTLAVIVTLISLPFAFRGTLAQMEGPVVFLERGRIHTRWTIAARAAAILIVNLACTTGCLVQADGRDGPLAIVGLVGCGVPAAMSLVNLITFAMNRSQQIHWFPVMGLPGRNGGWGGRR